MEPNYGVSTEYFLWSLLLGAAAGVFYDLFRIKRKIVHTSVFAVVIEDILCFIIGGAAVFAVAYFKNCGQLRLQGVVGVAGGVLIYRLALKDVFVLLSVRFISLAAKCAREIIKILIFPLLMIFKYILKPLIILPAARCMGHIRRSNKKIIAALRAFSRGKTTSGDAPDEADNGE